MCWRRLSIPCSDTFGLSMTIPPLLGPWKCNRLAMEGQNERKIVADKWLLRFVWAHVPRMWREQGRPFPHHANTSPLWQYSPHKGKLQKSHSEICAFTNSRAYLEYIDYSSLYCRVLLKMEILHRSVAMAFETCKNGLTKSTVVTSLRGKVFVGAFSQFLLILHIFLLL